MEFCCELDEGKPLRWGRNVWTGRPLTSVREFERECAGCEPWPVLDCEFVRWCDAPGLSPALVELDEALRTMMLFIREWPDPFAVPSSPFPPSTRSSQPLKSKPRRSGFARGDPLTESMFSSFRGHRGYVDDDEAGICGLKWFVDGTRLVVVVPGGRNGLEGEANGILDGDAGRGWKAALTVGLWGLGEAACEGIRCRLRTYSG